MSPLYLLRGDKPLEQWHSGCDAVEFIGDINIPNAWIVYVTYSDGGTFSQTHGNTQAIKAYEKREDAEKMIKSINNGGDGGIGYKPWEGNFASFNCVKMRLLPISD